MSGIKNSAYTITCFLLLLSFGSKAQIKRNLGDVKQNSFEIIEVQKLASDEQGSSFVIWVKKEVTEHYHQHHSEHIYMLEGEGLMHLNQEEIPVKEGDYVFIPKGTKHSLVVTSDEPVKVLSIQTPEFFGKDRVYTKD